MGLNKTKKILTQADFHLDQFAQENMRLSAASQNSMPTDADDIMLAPRQNVYYSIEHALKRLLQNDLFIDKFYKTGGNFVSSAVEHDLSIALSSNITIDPSTTTIYNNYLNQHINEYHIGTNNILSTVNEQYLNTDFSNFDLNGALTAFQHKSGNSSQALEPLNKRGEVALSNDFVINYEFNDSPNVLHPLNYVNVAVMNKKTGYEFKQIMKDKLTTSQPVPKPSESTYIYKEWMSGFKELYIYVPTTYTFYNENVDGEDINKNATWIRVRINARHFHFNHIYQAHICGQSLPMQIHNDNTNINYFNDVILPSMLRNLALGSVNESEGNTNSIYDPYYSQYVLYFVCYGTDAQAIRIFGD